MKALVCAVLLFVLFSSGTTSESNRYGDWFLGKLFFRPNVPPEGPSAKLEIESHGEKLDEIERSLKDRTYLNEKNLLKLKNQRFGSTVLQEVQEKLLELEKSLKKRDDFLQSIEGTMKQVEDSMNGRYETLQDRLAELELNQTSINGSLQESVKSFAEKHYESVQSTFMELENNITARDDFLQEIERSIKEMTQNMNRSEAKLIEFEKQDQAKDNTIQNMMHNMTRLEDHSKLKHEELEANLNKLQNVTEIIIKNSFPRSCKNVSSNQSGTYTIYLGNGQFKTVLCEQTAFDGGWIVFQYRFNGKVDFYRTWDEYRDGFGTIDGEFWLGLKYLHQLTSTRKHELMVEVKDYDGNYGYAKYDHFEIGSEAQKFILKIGNYSGTAGDAMTYNHGMKFTSKDSDNDRHSGAQCAELHKGGWWYRGCTTSNLNGPYGKLFGYKAMEWRHLKSDSRAMVYTRMMLREIN